VKCIDFSEFIPIFESFCLKSRPLVIHVERVFAYSVFPPHFSRDFSLSDSIMDDDRWKALQDAAQRFKVEETFGLVEVEEVMEAVFGAYTSRAGQPDAVVWQAYFDKLNEHIRDPLECCMPEVSGPTLMFLI
jgi:hypothetical protein